MVNTALTLLLSAQLICSMPRTPAPAAMTAPIPQTSIQESRLWWGMIDPELSAWLARLPMEKEADKPILWDWSWRNFLAALFGQDSAKEEITDAPSA